MSKIVNYLNIRKLFNIIWIRFFRYFDVGYNGTTVVFKSSNFIVVSKGYDIKINSNKEGERTIQTFVKEKFPLLASERLYHGYYFMHRLDYSTSGLMCIPIHKRACQEASKAIQEHKCKKFYIALVRGYLSRDFLDLNFPIGRDCNVREIEKMCVIDTGRAARTLVSVLEFGLYDDFPTTKILIRPITGRRHQIRVHCSYIGHTIVGDYTYSNKRDASPRRMYLHALRLVIPNVIEDLNVETEDPFVENSVWEWNCISKLYTIDEAFERIDKFVCEQICT